MGASRVQKLTLSIRSLGFRRVLRHVTGATSYCTAPAALAVVTPVASGHGSGYEQCRLCPIIEG